MNTDKNNYDVIVVGSGPAGASAASILGASNMRVLLVDKDEFPRDKTCGDGITFKCVEPMKRLGVYQKFSDSTKISVRGYSVFSSDDSELTVKMPPSKGKSVVHVVPRYTFDQIIHHSATQHESVEFLPNTKVNALKWEGDKVVGIVCTTGDVSREFGAKLIIDASGANSTLAVEAGMGNRDPKKCALAMRGYYENVDNLSDTIELYFDDRILPGYFWIFPTGPRSANVGCGTFQHLIESRKLDLRKLMEEFIHEHSIGKTKLAGATLCGTLKGGKIPLAMDHESSRVRNGLILVGDAASFTDPITAEGISYAMKSGIFAADVGIAAIAKGDVSATALGGFDDLWKSEFLAQFSRAPYLVDSLEKEAFSNLVSRSALKSKRVQAAMGNPSRQYELLLKTKALLKAL